MIVRCNDVDGATIKWPFYLQEESLGGIEASSSRASVISSRSGKSFGPLKSPKSNQM